MESDVDRKGTRHAHRVGAGRMTTATLGCFRYEYLQSSESLMAIKSRYPLTRDSITIRIFTPTGTRNRRDDPLLVLLGEEFAPSGYVPVESLEVELPYGMRRLWMDKWQKTTAHARVPGTSLYAHSIAEITEHAKKILGYVLHSVMDEFIDLECALGVIEGNIAAVTSFPELDAIKKQLELKIRGALREPCVST